ncbi:MAG: ClC family H(+)/Cl(-) exchange transporter [Treponema sp.]|jgi:H+/Cl- antiporter ClcA|nr:ClC family H(+)/Cl(-) exchange transporter [Treponema sp.]
MAETRHHRPYSIQYIYNSRLALVFESILIGLITGLLVVFFRYSLSRSDEFRRRLYGILLVSDSFYRTLFWAFALILLGLFLGWAAGTFPMIRGSGIPQIEGTLHRELVLNWRPELPLKILTGIIGLGAGLSLGREGPSIQIGAYVGKGVLQIFRRPYRERKILTTAASAAGLAAAFNAPLAGVLFVLEELQAGFSPLGIACAMGASITADAVAGRFFGLGPVFNFHEIKVLSLHSLPWVVVLGIFAALLGDFFKRSLYFSQDLYTRLKIPQIARPLIPLMVSIPLGFFLFDATGGGHALIEALAAEGRTLEMIVLLFFVKIFFTSLCYGSGTSGGIFLPLLACGALLGDGFARLLVFWGFIAETQILNFLILGMAAYFTGVVKAPVTGVILILEMSGSFNHLGSLSAVCLVTFVSSELINSRPVYTVLLERMIKNIHSETRAGPARR